MPKKLKKSVASNQYERRSAALYSMGFDSYRDYLDSALWNRIRIDVFNHKGRKCVCCGKRANQIHHKKYTKDVLEGLKFDYLVPICNICHKEIEFDGDRKRGLRGANKCLRRKMGKFLYSFTKVYAQPKAKMKIPAGEPAIWGELTDYLASSIVRVRA